MSANYQILDDKKQTEILEDKSDIIDEEMLINIFKELTEIKTKRNEKAYIHDKKFIYLKERQQKDSSILYRCKEYRRAKCKAYLSMKDNKLLKANISHSHEVDLKEINRYLTRHIIINKIESSENCLNLKIKKLYEDILIKSKEPETIPKFNGIKTQLYLKLNKNLPNDVDNLSQVDVENDYFKTEDGENFVIYNDNNVIILQSKIQSKIMFENSDDIFLDGTFYSAPKCVYQILIIRVNIKGTRTYATTCFALCSNKKEELYYLILSEINKNLNYNNDGIFKPYKIHIDFEIGLSNAIIRAWNESQIKY